MGITSALGSWPFSPSAAGGTAESLNLGGDCLEAAVGGDGDLEKVSTMQPWREPQKVSGTTVCEGKPPLDAQSLRKYVKFSNYSYFRMDLLN